MRSRRLRARNRWRAAQAHCRHMADSKERLSEGQGPLLLCADKAQERQRRDFHRPVSLFAERFNTDFCHIRLSEPAPT